MLTRETYIGRECFRMTRTVRDPETGKVTIEKRPRKEWLIRESPQLRIISDDLWELTQKRIEECAKAYDNSRKDAPKRTEVYPKTLVRPICGSCGNELMFGRSGKYASFCCLNGIMGKHNCSFKGYKSVKIVETSILNHLREHVFTEEFLTHFVVEANQQMQQRMTNALRDRSRNARTSLDAISSRRLFTHPLELIHDKMQYVDEIENRLQRAITTKTTSSQQQINQLALSLETLSPLAVLKRGYSITTHAKTGRSVRSPKDVKPGDKLCTRLGDGEITSRVE